MNSEPEVRIACRSVSRGIAIGTAVCLYGQKRQFYRIALPDNHIDREIRRFRAAVRLAKRQLGNLEKNTSIRLPGNSANIFDVHKMFLEDASLVSKIEDTILSEKVNAEWAIKLVTDSYISKYKAIPDEGLREKYIDLEDIKERLFTALGGGSKANIRLDRNTIIVSREMNPSMLIELAESNPIGMITEHGGWTSHTFILAREMNLPAVTGARKILRRLNTGDTAIVDGFGGQIIVNPSEESLKEFKHRANRARSTSRLNGNVISGPLHTLDGREIIIRANVDIPGSYEKAKKAGAKGIGLYRSEFLFNQFRGIPSESRQIAAYRKIADLAGEHGVKIRTFDIGLEDLTDRNVGKQKNPALGLRAIRLSLAWDKQFRTQIRALLQAAHNSYIDIVLPMISDVSEIRKTKAIIEEEKVDLRAKDIPCGEPGLGAMIEVPSAVLLVKEISQEVDLLCLGTNDLVQYLLAVDRDNESAAEWFRTLNPAVIRAVRTVIDVARDNSIPVVVCGEMAGSAFYAPVLVGLGATEFSMNPNSIPGVSKVISGIAYSETLDLIRQTEACSTAAEIEAVLQSNIRERWSHLFPAESPI